MLTVGRDNWSGSISGEWERNEPSREDIYDAVAALDGQVRTEVSVNFDEPYQYLSVAGGPEHFLVTGELADESVVSLTNPTAGPGQVELVCGGQIASFELTQLVDIETARRAVDRFLDGFPSVLGPEWEVEQ
ncbi:hypothetical protein [Glycomyces buryatensis]|uniref:Uncharacterized protein n=1 Tax=Glycomyces buryatensis TaxID=2570927 RepID=A0A4V4HSJ7_9ACTN|nr:hypothetical protein [Glycomyces buryatensis]THV41216.1 hypothetical protein FAB82_12730 [Glycomyces buryatensis]